MLHVANDKKILDVTRVTQKDGGMEFFIPAEYMPTQVFRQRYSEKSAATFIDWCQRVRNEYERQASEKAEKDRKDSRAERSGEGRTGTDRHEVRADDSGETLPGPETDLEAFLESQIVGYKGRIDALDSDIAETREALAGLQRKREETVRRQTVAIRALKTVREVNGEASTPKDDEDVGEEIPQLEAGES